MLTDLYFLIYNIDLVTRILLGVFVISFLVQIIYYPIVFLRSARQSPKLKRTRKKLPPISILISARNEEQNLSKNLDSFLGQDYPEYEVIVVNDCSDDNTGKVLEEFSKKNKNLKICTVKKDPKFDHGKKLALTLGIKASIHEIILLSDADCTPASNQWIRYMVRNYRDSTGIVLGVGLYRKKKGLLNLLIRFETAFIAMQYISMARMKLPYMGVGRNLSYRKSLFFENRGFASHLGLESGDDDLFVSEVATTENTVVENHPESFTYSEPESNFPDWIRQKKRHLTTGRFYQHRVKFVFGLEYTSRMLLTVSFIALLFKYPYYLYPLVVYILSLIVKGIIYNIAFKRFKENFLFLPALLMDAIIPFLYSYLHFVNYIERKRSRWQ